MDSADVAWLWKFLVFGYLFTIAIETPILLIGLSPRHPMRHRIFAGFWLTACTYPILVLVLPQFIDLREHRALFLAMGETFVPLAECALFWAAFGKREEWLKKPMWRDLAVVVLANLVSFGLGELVQEQAWYQEWVTPPAAPANPEDTGDGEALYGRPDGAAQKDPIGIVEWSLPASPPAKTPISTVHYKSARFALWGCSGRASG
jgi:hypothetical protein